MGSRSVLVDITAELRTQAAVVRDSALVARLAERRQLMAGAGTDTLERLGGALALLDGEGPLDAERFQDLERIGVEVRACIGTLRAATDEPAEPTEPSVVTEPSSGRGLEHRPCAVPEHRARGSIATTAARSVCGSRRSRSPRFWTSSLSSSPSGTLSLSLRYANQAAQDFARRWRRDNLIGLRLSDILDEDFVLAHQQYAERALRGRPSPSTGNNAAPRARSSTFQVRYVPRVVGQEVVGAFAYATDITPRVTATQALTDARAAYAALEERRAIEEQIHGTVLQELFAATLILDSAGRSSEDANLAAIKNAQTSLVKAVQGLEQLAQAYSDPLRLSQTPPPHAPPRPSPR